MIGSFLSKVVKVVTVPVDIVEAGIDCMTGGDGSKASRNQMKENIPCASSLRDNLCKILKDIDED